MKKKPSVAEAGFALLDRAPTKRKGKRHALVETSSRFRHLKG
jgi:hypothetical protein